MIKIKIQNPFVGRNEPTFRPLLFVKDMLRDYSIDITESDDYDYLFIGMADFIDKRVSLQDSIDKGLENLSKITGDYFLFDGSDSHSLMGAYEVFDQSNAIYLFKQQLHRDPNNYKIPKAFNKWFMGSGSDLDLAYDIPKSTWDRIKLTGWNFMSHIPDHKKFLPINTNKTIDICAVFGTGNGNPSYDHMVRNDEYYTSHRKQIWKELNKLSKKYNIVSGRQPWNEYMQTLYNSKICISPFGMGEIRQGDGEAIQLGTIICKEDMSQYDFGTNAWHEEQTYLPYNFDCSNLVEQIEKILGNYNNYSYIIDNMRHVYTLEYDYHKLCMRWYNIFSNMDSISNE
tara:strand:+ start:714 stop:1739 length:1026 start_codon:yes stop_codon:yes gene_type:complete